MPKCYDYFVRQSRQHGDYLRPRRGECSIEYDGRTWIYRVPRGERKTFKALASEAFGYRRIKGRYPCYQATNR